MRILVLGGNGFIGKSLVSHYGGKVEMLASYDLHEKAAVSDVNYIKGDFARERHWGKILENVDVCFHLVSTTLPKTSNDDPYSDVSSNLLGTLRLLDAAKGTGTKVIFASSGGTIYGNVNSDEIHESHAPNPLCSYGIVKLAIEKYLYMYRELHGLSYVVLRLANPYGPNQNLNNIQGAPAVFLGRALSGGDIDVWGTGEQVRDFIYIDDVVQAFDKAVHYEGVERVFNIGSGSGASLNDLIHVIQEVIQKPLKINYHIPRSLDVQSNVLCIKRALSAMGWNPSIGLSQGMQQMVGWAASAYDFSCGYPPRLK